MNKTEDVSSSSEYLNSKLPLVMELSPEVWCSIFDFLPFEFFTSVCLKISSEISSLLLYDDTQYLYRYMCFRLTEKDLVHYLNRITQRTPYITRGQLLLSSQQKGQISLDPVGVSMCKLRNILQKKKAILQTTYPSLLSKYVIKIDKAIEDSKTASNSLPNNNSWKASHGLACKKSNPSSVITSNKKTRNWKNTFEGMFHEYSKQQLKYLIQYIKTRIDWLKHLSNRYVAYCLLDEWDLLEAMQTIKSLLARTDVKNRDILESQHELFLLSVNTIRAINDINTIDETLPNNNIDEVYLKKKISRPKYSTIHEARFLNELLDFYTHYQTLNNNLSCDFLLKPHNRFTPLHQLICIRNEEVLSHTFTILKTNFHSVNDKLRMTIMIEFLK